MLGVLMVNVNFDYYEDTPHGGDPDSLSPTLNKHHNVLWSKRLPNGRVFDLKGLRANGKLLLHHHSELGDFSLSSDMITHSLYYSDKKTAYSKWFPCGAIRSEIPDVIKDFWKHESGIACYTIFPARQVNRQHTINQARGVNRKICDRFDLTLECIRRYYQCPKDANPLYDTLKLYREFFDLFGDFKGYMEFFHFQDLVNDDGSSIHFWLPFDDFRRSPLPQNSQEYRQYKDSVCEFIDKRKKRISDWTRVG
jgi:hypothetical protein